MEGRNSSSGVTKQYGTDIGYEGCRTCRLCKRYAMVAGVGLGDPGILAGCLPVEAAAVNDHTADSCSMSADKLGSRMYYDVCTILNGTNQERSCKGGIHYQGNIMLMSNLCYFL